MFASVDRDTNATKTTEMKLLRTDSRLFHQRIVYHSRYRSSVFSLVRFFTWKTGIRIPHFVFSTPSRSHRRTIENGALLGTYRLISWHPIFHSIPCGWCVVLSCSAILLFADLVSKCMRFANKCCNEVVSSRVRKFANFAAALRRSTFRQRGGAKASQQQCQQQHQ